MHSKMAADISPNAVVVRTQPFPRAVPVSIALITFGLIDHLRRSEVGFYELPRYGLTVDPL
jgi:hypothetical protein